MLFKYPLHTLQYTVHHYTTSYTIMKKIYATIICLFGITASYAQLSGTKTVGAVGRDYPTLDSAINHLNTVGIDTSLPGGVTFEVDAGHTETLLTGKVINVPTSRAANPIIIRKSGVGANPLISAQIGTSTTVDGIISISGTDYITIENINLVDPASHTTATTRMEWGYGILKQSGSNGCSNVTISGCTVTLIKANTPSKGIYIANHLPTSTTATTVTSLNGIHQYISIIGNNITNTYIGISSNGSSSTTYYNDSININNNTITNFGGTSTVCYGILAIYSKRITIANDSIVGGNSTTGTTYGISTETSTNGEILVTGNYVSLATSTTTNSVFGIRNSAGTNGYVTISNNRIMNCTSTTMTTGVFNGINNSATPFVINIHNNTISGNTRNASSGVTNYILHSAGVLSNIYSNIISGNTTTPSSTGANYGITLSGGTGNNVYDNIIQNNTIVGSSSSTIAMAGIYSSGGTSNIFKNKIHGLTGNTAGVVVSGILIASAIEGNIYNNVIGNLVVTIASANSAVNGINVTSSTATQTINIRHNSIYLDATSTGANFGSNGISVNTGPAVELIGNLIVNLSSSNGTGRTVAYRRSSTNMATYSTASNYNSFYAGVPSTSRLIFSDNTNNLETLNSYYAFSLLGPRDQSSISASPTFISTVGTSANFLLVDSTAASQLESASIPITGLLGDYRNANARASYPLTAQINGGGQSPDIGAFDQDFMLSDSTSPEIVFLPLRRGTISTGRSLENVLIKDKSKVKNAIGSKPRIYFKARAHGNFLALANNSSNDGWKYTEAINNTSPYSFAIDHSLLFGGIVNYNDTIEYFITASDSSAANNVRVASATLASPAFSANLTGANFPVSNVLHSYAIDTALLSSFIVGGTGTVDFTSLTRADGLFNAINNGVITGNITVTIVNDILNENGAIALEPLNSDGPTAAANTITIIPGNVNIMVSGSISGGLIKLRNTSNIIIDGNYLSAPHNLSILNTVTSGASATIHIIGTNDNVGSSNITIANCNIATGNKVNTTGYDIFVGSNTITPTTTSGGYFNSYIRILNNKLYKAAHGIGITSFNSMHADSILIANNTIGSYAVADYIGAMGIRISGMNRGIIKSNKIFNIISTTTSLTTLNGILLSGNVRNSSLEGNDIDNISYATTQYNTTNGISITANPNANVVIKNNIIKRIISSGQDFSAAAGPNGIYLVGTGNDYKIYNNSVHLTGNRALNTWTYVFSPSSTYTYNLSNAYSCALAVSSTTISGLDIRNNVLSNRMTGSSVTPGYNFAFYSTAPNANYTHLSHNTYFAASTTPAITNGLYSSSVQSTLAGMRVNLPIDKYSIFGNPGFIDDTTLTILPTDTNAWNVSGRGMPLAEVSTDALGNPRSVSTLTGAIDAGAFEFTTPTSIPPAAVQVNTPALGSTSYYLYKQDTVASIDWSASSSLLPLGVEVRYYPGESPTAPTSGSNFMNATWVFDGNGINAGLDFNLTLYYSPAHLGSVNPEADMKMANYQSSVWVPYTGTASTVNTATKRLTANGLNSLYEFTGTSSTRPLPVKLTSFDAKLKGKNILTNWSTSTEVNASHFVLERSFDSKEFKEVTSVKASNKVTGASYAYTDDDAVRIAQKNSSNTIYYRLKQVDLNGFFEYSKTIRVMLGNPEQITIVSAVPNPFVNNIELTFTTLDENATVSIVDISGKIIYNQQFTTKSMEPFNTNIALFDKLENGIYFLTVETKSGRQTLKLLKN